MRLLRRQIEPKNAAITGAILLGVYSGALVQLHSNATLLKNVLTGFAPFKSFGTGMTSHNGTMLTSSSLILYLLVESYSVL